LGVSAKYRNRQSGRLLTEISRLLNHQVGDLSAGMIKVVSSPRDGQAESCREIDEEGEDQGALYAEE
jgi:hypothetical protein